MFALQQGGAATRRRSSANPKTAAADPARQDTAPLEGQALAVPAPELEPRPERGRPAPRPRGTARLRVVKPELPRGAVTPKIAAFLAKTRPATPCLVVDLDVVEQNYLALSAALQPAQLYYAIKANPAPKVLRLLARRGSNFDVASRGEIDLCLSLGIAPARLSYGNTIKKQADIAYAYEKGVRLFAFDSEGELDKLAAAAPGARVFCRVLTDGSGADWPLSRKFGCSFAMAADLLARARALGLDACGVSFHVGSQQTDLGQWDRVLGQVAGLFGELRARGLEPRLVNLGGGFPSRYRQDVPAVEDYAAGVMVAVRKHFPVLPELVVEPGRGIVGDAGVIEAEVVLVSTKDAGDDCRWVYLDVGKFSGLAETMDEAIKYRLVTEHDGGPDGPVVLAGPTCDSADILYERSGYRLPLALKPGDKVRILSCGAYTTTYSSVGFNGFGPLKTYSI
jgi:ornithine decarboxylase